MAQTSADAAALKQAYIEIAKAERAGDYERAFKAANRILKNHPKEVTAFGCKLVSLIQLNKFQDAIDLIKKTPPNQTGECIFEKAYCEYRLSKNDDAIKTLQKADDDDNRCKELLGQLYYRTERFQQCQEVYRKLLIDHTDNYDEERRANLLAVESQLQAMGVRQPDAGDLDSYEQYFNSACKLIEDENYAAALKKLKTSERLCRDSLAEDDVPEEEIEDELSVIRTQMAFCYQAMGSIDQALDMYNDVLKIKPSDATVTAVASNNLLSAKKELSQFDARKKLKAAQQVADNKLTVRQRRTLALNKALLNFHNNQLEPCRRLLNDLRSQFHLNEEATLIEAALFMRQKDNDKAIKLLADYQQQQHDGGQSDGLIALALVQMKLADGKPDQIVRALSSLPDGLRWQPGILSLIVAFELAASRQVEALSLLKEAVKRHENSNKEVLAAVLDQCASLHIKLGKDKDASVYLEKLRQYLQKKATKQTPKPGGDQDEQIITGKMRNKRKRKRKQHLPKNIDPNVIPDPERWLPKQERSTYKRRKDKRYKDRDIGKGTQGAVGAAAMEQLDSSGRPSNSVDVSQSPKVNLPAAEGPRQQRPGGGQPAKKKKKKTGKF